MPRAFIVYVVVLAGLLTGLIAKAAAEGYLTDELMNWALLTTLFTVTEFVALSFYDEKTRWGLSSGEAILLPMIMTLAPGQVVISAALAIVVLRWKDWGETPLKEAFNVCQYGVAAGVAAGVWAVLNDLSGAFTFWNVLIATVAVITFAALTHIFVALGFHLAGRGSFIEALKEVAPAAMMNLAGNTVLGLFFAAAMLTSNWTVFLFPLPLVALYFGYRAIVQQSKERERVEQLHGASQALARGRDLAGALTGFLVSVSQMVSAKDARVLLETGDDLLWSGVSSGEPLAQLEPAKEGPLTMLLDQFRKDPTPLVLGNESDARGRLVSSLIGSNLIAVPVRIQDETIGCLVVQERVGAGEFQDAEARLLQALATELALTIESRRLSEEITIERAQAQDEKQSLQNQLHQAQKLETVGRLAGGIAHDFNNLLSVMLNYSRFVLEAVPDGDPIKEDVKEIKEAAERAASLTRQLLIFSRREIPVQKVTDLNDVLSGLERLLQRSLGDDIVLKLDLAPELSPVKVDSGQMEQVLLNLVINARDALAGAGGAITIETSNVELDESFTNKTVDLSPGRYVRLSVADPGCGMSPEIQAQIFEPFFTTKPKEVGTGLGLATVYGIVRQSAGHIAVESEPGRGSTFTIYLPVTDEVMPSPEQQETPSIKGRGETVLVVEDQDAVRAVARRILANNGYEVVEASSGREALAKMASRGSSVDLVLSDVVMPKMSGIELVERMTATVPDLKVVYMSGYNEAMSSAKGRYDESALLVQKPFTETELLEKIREALER